MTLPEANTPAPPSSRRRGRFRRLAAFLAYAAVSSLCIYYAFRGLDIAAGRFLLISPWPPAGLHAPAMEERQVQFYDFDYVARTNSMGLRGDEIPPKRPGVLRVLAIGDSYVFGWGVNLADTWVAQLNAMFNGAGREVEIINGGMLGNGPVEYAERAECLIPTVRPDLVLVCILQGSDLVETPSEFHRFPNLSLLVRDWSRRRNTPPPSEVVVWKGEATREFEAGEAKKRFEQMPPEQRSRFDRLDETVKQAFFDGKLNSGMVDGATKWPRWYIDIADDTNEALGEKTQTLAAMVLRIERIARRFGARAWTVLMPEGPFVNHAAITNWGRLGFELTPELFGSETPERHIGSASEQAGVPFVNLAAAFRAHGNDAGLYFVLDSHMTPAGHRLVAETLFPLLAKEAP